MIDFCYWMFKKIGGVNYCGFIFKLGELIMKKFFILNLILIFSLTLGMSLPSFAQTREDISDCCTCTNDTKNCKLLKNGRQTKAVCTLSDDTSGDEVICFNNLFYCCSSTKSVCIPQGTPSTTFGCSL